MIANFFMLVDSLTILMIFRFVMSNSQAIYNVLYFHHVCCNVIPILMLVS
jgi:hypothetical protein